MDYRPIDCSIHDQYLAWATRRTPVTVELRRVDGTDTLVSGVIVDVYTAPDDGAEWMLIAGERIRLDRILGVAPVIGTGPVAG